LTFTASDKTKTPPASRLKGLRGINDSRFNESLLRRREASSRMSVHPDKAGRFFYVLQESVRLLFVDDDPILREFAQVNLASEHATVDVAPDGAAALDAVASSRPDLILLDLEMPGLDGFGVLRALRADPRWRDLPVIVVTGREDVEAVDRAFAEGATSFVVKPLNWRLLSHQVRYVRRMAQNERTMAAKLVQLATAASKFIAVALRLNPQLRSEAVAFANAADAAMVAHDPAKAA
jgi:CheY-like chemotaxis protein